MLQDPQILFRNLCKGSRIIQFLVIRGFLQKYAWGGYSFAVDLQRNGTDQACGNMLGSANLHVEEDPAEMQVSGKMFQINVATGIV